ncbi:GNAT family N-acetyltransferase [Thaumasiovibrio subtropicus]|uniref:GNAT family N-acetyltransferase n=1 Tax=Thaumasiovibrio subtropicus TaxID=1891207 RepID=UPI000B34CF85|nr:GNAT family N-acetyltransferase [Thaumasiovibrio subtropicus]
MAADIGRQSRDAFLKQLGNAFHDDPFFQAVASQPLQRAQSTALIGKLILNDSQHRRTVYANSDFSSAILWQDLRQPQRHNALYSLWLNLSWIWSGCLPRLKQMQSGIKQVDAAVTQLHQQSQLYLSLLYVSPLHRGQGVARQLMSPLLLQCDEQQLICGVDTYNPTNVPIYQHFGFSLVGTTAVNGELNNYQLLRHPR